MTPNEEGLFVAASTVLVPVGGEQSLEAAFQNRLGAVERSVGFRGLQVWRDARTEGSYLMVSWWETRQAWVDYMGSAEHAASHARIPDGPLRPRPGGLRMYEVVAT